MRERMFNLKFYTMKRILFACAMGMPLAGFLDYMAMLAYGSDKPTVTHVWMGITGVCIFWICYELTPKILNSTKPNTESESEVLNIPRVSNAKRTVCNCQGVDTTDIILGENGKYYHVLCNKPITN